MEDQAKQLALHLTVLDPALGTLEEVLREPYSVIVRDATIQRFEYTFELAWKLFRKVAKAAADERMFNIIHSEAVIKVDFIVRKSSEYRLVEFARRRRVSVGDLQAFLVTREDLVLSKLLWAKDSRSELQLRDVRNLLAENCEEAYLAYWAQRLGVWELLEECRA